MKHPLVCSLVLCLCVGPAFKARGQTEQSIFDIPTILSQNQQVQLRVLQSLRAKDWTTAATACRAGIRLVPDEPTNYYNLACCLAHLGKSEEALSSLAQAVDRGFNNARHIQQDEDLKSLRELPKFAEIVKKAPAAKRQIHPLMKRKAQPSAFDEQVALVSDKNTTWVPQLRSFQSMFKLEEPRGPAVSKVTTRSTKVAKQVHDWYVAGTAAGLQNHLYDNHDNDHSNMKYAYFPQLKRVEYSEAAKKRQLHNGLQLAFFYNAITIGNSSTAITSGQFWRSQPRLALSSPRGAAMLYLQYTNNHLYVYPEHKDHDPKHGDVYFANTPYCLISQGSSGSDREFLEAIAWTLASFRPKVKELLSRQGALMPTVQMVFRRANQRVKTEDDYLTGVAHPTVFDGKTIDQWRLIHLAHNIKPDNLPPLVRLRVVEEDTPVLGVDYFDERAKVKIFDTPSAIARAAKSSKHTYRMVVSAEQSRDLNKRQLTYHWKVLRGDAQAIKIKPLNESKSVVEIIVPYHGKRPIEPGSELMGNRVDIGAFVHNGQYYSAPAFVSIHNPRNEVREYDKQNRIQSIEYLGSDKRYADPVITLSRAWRDDYRYDAKGRLIGWIRTRGKDKQEFTAAGALVTKKDDQGRALQARTVSYVAAVNRARRSVLKQQPGNEILHYQYASSADKIGRVAERTSAQ